MVAAVRDGQLVLADGSVFDGELFGAQLPAGGVVSGEVVFNTVLSGYQEVVTDPSYAGQIITFTTPHIGNYGVNTVDFESRRPFCRGLIVRQPTRRYSNHRAEASFESMLTASGITALGGIDTRRLTRLLRDTGSMNGAYGSADTATLLAAARAEPGTDGLDLVATVTTTAPYTVGRGERVVVAYDFGLKQSILRDLAGLGTVHVVPASTTAEEALALAPAGVFLSNGPGDPAQVRGAVDAIAGLLGRVPVFGICLGHQLLSRALGGQTFKLPFGHHGGNHPVRHEPSGHIEITSQNHNFCVEPESLGDQVEITHVNLNDHTLEGMRVKAVPAFSVQYHPEAGPGPHDSKYLFAMFSAMMSDPQAWQEGRPIGVAIGGSLAGYEAEVLITPDVAVV